MTHSMRKSAEKVAPLETGITSCITGCVFVWGSDVWCWVGSAQNKPKHLRMFSPSNCQTKLNRNQEKYPSTKTEVNPSQFPNRKLKLIAILPKFSNLRTSNCWDSSPSHKRGRSGRSHSIHPPWFYQFFPGQLPIFVPWFHLQNQWIGSSPINPCTINYLFFILILFPRFS